MISKPFMNEHLGSFHGLYLYVMTFRIDNHVTSYICIFHVKLYIFSKFIIYSLTCSQCIWITYYELKEKII